MQLVWMPRVEKLFYESGSDERWRGCAIGRHLRLKLRIVIGAHSEQSCFSANKSLLIQKTSPSIPPHQQTQSLYPSIHL